MEPATNIAVSAVIWIMMTLTDGQVAYSDYGPDGLRLTAEVCRREAHKLRFGGIVELREHVLLVSEASCFSCSDIGGCTALIPQDVLNEDADAIDGD